MPHYSDPTWACGTCQEVYKKFGLTCQSTFKWLIDCSKLTSSSTNPTLKQCHACNWQNIRNKLLDLLTFVIPFGAAYGDWLGGVTDPDLNLTMKAMTGTFLVDLVLEEIVGEKVDSGTHKQDDPGPITRAILDTLGVGGWVLMAQVVQDFVFHGAPNRVIGALVAGLANYFRTVGSLPSGFQLNPEQIGGTVIFLTSMASFAGNWSMMGDNVMSRFASCAFASFLSFFSAIDGRAEKCIYTYSLWPKKVLLDAIQLGFVSGLMGTFTQSAIGKPVVSGLVAGFTALWVAHNIFNGDNFKNCDH